MIAVDPSGPPPILGSTAYTGPPPIVVNQNLPTVDVQHPHAHPLNGPQGSPFLLKTPIPTSPGWYFQILLYSNLYLIPITHVPKYPSTRVPNLSDEYSDSFSCFACLIVQIGVSFWPIKARSHQTIRNFDWLITINNQLIFFGHKFIPNICFTFRS